LRVTSRGLGDVYKRQGDGIGLQNLRLQLALLYPGRHQLTVSHEKNSFIANLELSL
jgi:hypothetical protein